MPRRRRNRKSRNRFRRGANMGKSFSKGSTQSSTSSCNVPTIPSGHNVPSTELLSLFQCPVCYDYAVPPIMQCFRGHCICNNCRSKVEFCPICRGLLMNVRNLAMDELAAKLMFPCTYAFVGCTAALKCGEKEAHEETCMHRHYSCPCNGGSCNWQGPISKMYGHLKKCHKSIRILRGENIRFVATEINLTGTVDWVMVETCFDRHFLITLSKMPTANGQHVYCAFLRMLGTRDEVQKYVYFMELGVHKLENPWNAHPRYIGDSDDDDLDINRPDCMIFEENSIGEFIKDGTLGICISVRQMKDD